MLYIRKNIFVSSLRVVLVLTAMSALTIAGGCASAERQRTAHEDRRSSKSEKKSETTQTSQQEPGQVPQLKSAPLLSSNAPGSSACNCSCVAPPFGNLPQG